MKSSFCALLLSTLGGCCTLAELWCGPDRSRWVSVSFDTHQLTLATFMEAVRRDSPYEIFRSLSQQWKDDHGLTGSIEAAFAWERLKQQIVGVHLLGGAAITGPEPVDRNRVRYYLERSGYRFEVTLVQQTYWQVAYDDAGDFVEAGGYVRSMSRHLTLQDLSDGDYRVQMTLPAELEVEGVTIDRIQRAGMFRDWKIDGLRQIDAE